RGLTPATAEAWLLVLAAGKRVALDGDRVSPPGAAGAALTGEAAGYAGRIAEAYRSARFEPPRPIELARALGTKPAVVDGLVSHLLKSGLLVRLSPDLVVHRQAVESAIAKLDAVKGQTL